MSTVVEEDLVSLPYTERLTRLLQRHIGLWDVMESCRRLGSLDSAIRNARANDFGYLEQACPHPQRVCFNGKASGRLAPAFAAAGYETVILPSSSPANMQLSFDQKLVQWRSIMI